MPNSVYYVRRDRLDDLFDRLVDFMSAVDEAMADLRTGSADTDGLVQERWPTTSPGALHDVTQELVANGTWSGVRIEPDPAARWLSILFDAGLVDHEVAFAELVDQSVVDAVPTR
jgi:NitT/TauT family transport system substrate-binding protein